jgi:SAM-dependent methyltransferase
MMNIIDTNLISIIWDEIAEEWEKKIGDVGDVLHSEIITPQISYLLEKCEKVKTILDIGSANGYLVKILQDKGYEAYGMDLSEKMINFASKRVDKNFLFLADIQVIDSNEYPKFDCIIVSMVLDQIPKLNKAILNISNLLKQHGYVIVILPHPVFYLLYGQFEGQTNIENYNREGLFSVKLTGISKPIPYFHRKIETYLNTFLLNNLKIVSIQEPFTPKILKRTNNNEYPIVLSILLKK